MKKGDFSGIYTDEYYDIYGRPLPLYYVGTENGLFILATDINNPKTYGRYTRDFIDAGLDEIKKTFIKQGWSADIELTPETWKEHAVYRMNGSGNLYDIRGRVVLFNIPPAGDPEVVL